MNFLGGPKDPLKLLWNINIKADTAILLVARLIFKDGPFRPEMEKVGDTGDTSLLFFLAGANFWAILGNFWAILDHFWDILAIFGHFWAILGHFWANSGNFGLFFGYFG